MSTVPQTLDMIRASERLISLTVQLESVRAGVESVREVAPELGPELDAVLERLHDSYGHLIGAITVLSARLELL